MEDFGDFGDFGEAQQWDHVTGPLIGGGAAQIGTMASKLLWKNNASVVKWAPAIGLGLGAAISGALMLKPRYRALGLSSLLTAAVVALPRQIENMMGMDANTKDYLGVVVPEQMQGVWGADEGMGAFAPSQNVQVLDGGSGSTGVFGVTVPEQEMAGAGDVDLLGGGFGSNFLG